MSFRWALKTEIEKLKEFAPLGKGLGMQDSEVEVPKVVTLVKMAAESACVSVHLKISQYLGLILVWRLQMCRKLRGIFFSPLKIIRMNCLAVFNPKSTKTYSRCPSGIVTYMRHNFIGQIVCYIKKNLYLLFA